MRSQPRGAGGAGQERKRDDRQTAAANARRWDAPAALMALALNAMAGSATCGWQGVAGF